MSWTDPCDVRTIKCGEVIDGSVILCGQELDSYSVLVCGQKIYDPVDTTYSEPSL